MIAEIKDLISSIQDLKSLVACDAERFSDHQERSDAEREAIYIQHHISK